jgi:lipopolysaccharide export system permease protein
VVHPPVVHAPAPSVGAATTPPPPSAGVDANGRPLAGLAYRPGGATAAPGLPGPRVDPSVALAQATAQIDAARIRMQDTEQSMNGYDVEIQKKFALAVACIVFVLLGAPIALRFPRGGVGLTIAVSLGVFALYYVCLIAGEELANRGYVPPFWAMWAANVLFTIIGLVLLARMGREGATARGGDVGEAVEQLKTWVARQMRRVGVRADRRAPVT